LGTNYIVLVMREKVCRGEFFREALPWTASALYFHCQKFAPEPYLLNVFKTQ
jgi:hypothetical protein